MQPKRFIRLLLTALILGNTHIGAMANYAWISELPKPWLVQQEQLADILPQFHKRYPDYKARLRALAYWRIGTPYKIFNLGEEQKPDTDPIFRLDVSDCTSHILTTMSLANSQSWQQARSSMIDIHYKPIDEQVSPTYASRWHFTSDRILHHPMTPEITEQHVPIDAQMIAEVTLNMQQDGSEFLNLDWSQSVRVRYIPNQQITIELLAQLPDFIGIAFVKQSYFKMGIITAHEGMLIDQKYLLHAGQDAGETVKQDFMEYYFTKNGAKFDGIMLYDFVAAN